VRSFSAVLLLLLLLIASERRAKRKSEHEQEHEHEHGRPENQEPPVQRPAPRRLRRSFPLNAKAPMPRSTRVAGSGTNSAVSSVR